MADFSHFIVYADESGASGFVGIDPQYPVCALLLCVTSKADYADSVVPAV